MTIMMMAITTISYSTAVYFFSGSETVAKSTPSIFRVILRVHFLHVAPSVLLCNLGAVYAIHVRNSDAFYAIHVGSSDDSHAIDLCSSGSSYWSCLLIL